MTIAHRLPQSVALAALAFGRGRWFGPHHGFGLGGLLVILFSILLIFLCVRLLVSD
jgi:hypothetical protein